MSLQLKKEEAEFLVNTARKTVEEYLKTGKRTKTPTNVQKKLLQPYGVFVTINQIEDGSRNLRGCIGFPYPTTPLIEAVIDSAISAATQDPRFPPLSEPELDRVVFDVSILTQPQIIEVDNPKDYCCKIKVGEDGLIVERSLRKGLLLPQVPVEWGWDEETFLCQCCMKAGLPPDSWLVKGTRIYKFSSIVVEELSPRGKVKIIDMRKGTKGKD